MSFVISTKVLFFSGLLSLLQFSTNFVDLAQVSALTLSRGGTGMCESTDLATRGTSSNLNESDASESYENMAQSYLKVQRFLQGPDGDEKVCARERAYLLEKHLQPELESRSQPEQIDLSLNLNLDGSRLSVLPEKAGQNAEAFEIAEETSAASTLVRAQGWKTVGDLKAWIASVSGKSKCFINVFLQGTEMQLEDTRTLSEIGAEFKASNEASNKTGPVNLFVLESIGLSKDALVQDFLEQYSTRLNNFPKIESYTANQVVQKNEVTVRIERADIDTNTKTSSDKDSSPFYEFTFVRERKIYDSVIYESLYIVFREDSGSKKHVIFYDVIRDSWELARTDEDILADDVRNDASEDVSFKNNIGFLAKGPPSANPVLVQSLKIADLGEMTWAKLFTMYLIYGSFNNSIFTGCFSDHANLKELLIPAWEDFAVEFHNESAGTRAEIEFPDCWEPIPGSERLITKTDKGNVKIYASDREYYEKVEEKVRENWEGLRIADVTFKQT